MQEAFEYDRRFSAIAFTGGDVGGKSTLMPIAKKYLESQGMRVAIHAEVASEIISAGFSPSDNWKDSSFQEHIFRYVIEREEMYYRMLKGLATDKHLVLLCDRGVLDSIAYIGQEKFGELARAHGHHTLNLRERYKAVVHMVTAANGAEGIYLKSIGNNPGRIHRTPAEARALDEATIQAWMGHQHLVVVDNSTDFEGKIERAMTALRRVLPMPIPIERERKFKVLAGKPPNNCAAVLISQDYLKSNNGVERRVRMKKADGSSTFYYTEKRPTETLGAREENERQISPNEYWALLEETDPASVAVIKTRHTFVYKGRVFEHDVYHSPPRVEGLEIIEVENCSADENIEFPAEYEVCEVTGKRMYTNHSIAKVQPTL